MVCMSTILMVLAGRSFSAPLVVKQVDASSVSCVFNRDCKIVTDVSVPVPVLFVEYNPVRSRTYDGSPGSPAAGLYSYEYLIDAGTVPGTGTRHCVRSFTVPFGPVVSTLDFDGDKKIGDEVFVTREDGPGRTGFLSADQDTSGNVTFTFDTSACDGPNQENRDGVYSIGIVSTQPPVTVEATIKEVTGAVRTIALRAPQQGPQCSIPEYEPDYWNDCGGICGNNYCPCGDVQCDYCQDCGDTCGTTQCNNNCYNYATNRRTDTFAKPGCAAESMNAAIDCASVINAALADGLVAVPADGSCTGGKHKVALVVWPEKDYHWYRLDSSGQWSHKPGKHEATNLDNSNQTIDNPEKADRGQYTDFCGYFCACSDIRQGQGRQSVK